MPPSSTRTQACDRRDALARSGQADAYLTAANLVLDDTTDDANPGVAAALAVLGGIAASDAACCARLQRRPRGQSHREAVSLLTTVSPGGAAMAKDLQRLLDRKDHAHYGLGVMGQREALIMVQWAGRLTRAARKAVEA